VNGKHEAKIMLHEISGPPVEIWLSLLCPTTPVVNDLFTRLPQDKCKFSNSLKMWLFTYSLYEKVVTEFLTPPFENMRLTELPRFLSKGLGSYQKKVNKLNAGPELVLNLTPKVNATLLPFQLEAVRFVARRGGRALLGDDMGTAHTLLCALRRLTYLTVEHFLRLYLQGAGRLCRRLRACCTSVSSGRC
jgi:hypothetical protein